MIRIKNHPSFILTDDFLLLKILNFKRCKHRKNRNNKDRDNYDRGYTSNYDRQQFLCLEALTLTFGFLHKRCNGGNGKANIPYHKIRNCAKDFDKFVFMGKFWRDHGSV